MLRYVVWRFRSAADSVSGHSRLWPCGVWPFQFVTIFLCDIVGVWPSWPATFQATAANMFRKSTYAWASQTLVFVGSAVNIFVIARVLNHKLFVNLLARINSILANYVVIAEHRSTTHIYQTCVICFDSGYNGWTILHYYHLNLPLMSRRRQLSICWSSTGNKKQFKMYETGMIRSNCLNIAVNAFLDIFAYMIILNRNKLANSNIGLLFRDFHIQKWIDSARIYRI